MTKKHRETLIMAVVILLGFTLWCAAIALVVWIGVKLFAG